MIQITCTNCKTVLSIDEAFAGGVCRCRHCGTIQTVPKRLRDNAPDGNGQSIQAGGKAIYQHKKAAIGAQLDAAGSGTGLDELATVVAGSGLSSSGLASGRLTSPAKPETPAKAPDRKLVLIVSLGGVVILGLLGVIIFMAVQDRSNPPPPVSSNVRSTDTPKPPDNKIVWSGGDNVKVPKLPQFLGQRLNEEHKNIVYIIDRGQSSVQEGKFEPLKAAVLKSIESLGPQRKFQVVFWAVDNSKVWAFPENGLATATPDNIDSLRRRFDDVMGYGQTKLTPALERAARSNPDLLLLVPVKSFLDDAFHANVLKAHGNSKAKINTYSIGHSDTGEILKRVAKDTGGTYYDLKMVDLQAALR